MPRPALIAFSLLVGGLLSACVPDEGRPDFRTRAFLEIVAAEDARRVAGEDLDVLVAATSSSDAFLRAAGVRALGRLEEPELVEHIVPLLSDADADVRAEAANALAQAVHRGPGALALQPLLDRTRAEDVPGVRGVLARSLGRLQLPPEERVRVRRALVSLSRTDDDADADAPRPQLIGVALGMESFVRRRGAEPVNRALLERARELSRHGRTSRPQTETMAQVRELALMTLASAGDLSVYEIEAGLRDPGEGVRRVAAANLGRVDPGPRSELIRRSLRDPSQQVRLEAVGVIDRASRTELACTRLIAAATRDERVHVRLRALDALDEGCPQAEEQRGVLLDALGTLGEDDAPWQPPAHALVSLAALAPEEAETHLSAFTGHDDPFVRSWGARAAQRLGNRDVLRRLAADDSPNVQTVAVRALAELEGRAVDGLLLETLDGAEDPQLILVTAGLLRGTALEDQAARVALAALDRLTERRMQTLRDPRVALLELVREVGDDDLVERVEPYLRDSDPRVAELASTVLTGWTGQRWIDAPRAAERLPLPTASELQELDGAVVALEMEGGGTIEISLRPWLAPTNSFRLATLAREGRLDGLTFHRVVPNFVIQGGSPGANEYAGHGAYTRDELGLAVHWRGTVGVSTRGRDTGDGQIFVNLVDNVRLDHDYTLLGQVTAGMDVVDSVLEGNVIRSASVRIP